MEEAELGRVPNDDTWVQWSREATVKPGKHTLVVRATDRSGATQTAVRAGVDPRRRERRHTVEFEVRDG